MTAKLIESKAKDLRGKTRRQLLGAFAGPIAVAFFYFVAVKTFALPASVVHPLFATALGWSLVGLYFVSRGMWTAVVPADAGLRTGLEFCREEIGRRRAILRRLLLWSFGPVLMAIGSFIVALAMVSNSERSLIPNGLPFLVLVAAWIVGYFVIRMKEQRELTRELAALEEIASS